MEQTVYVVTGGYNGEDTGVLGVYSSKDKAKQAIEEDKNHYIAMDWYDIIDFIMD